MKKLYIFDLDDTLVKAWTDELLPGVVEFFRGLGSSSYAAIATNQGGVGLRYWMESAGFGEPGKYPTEEDVKARLESVQDQLRTRLATYVCYVYQSEKSKKWSPVPLGAELQPEWSPVNRKPAPGMLLQAMADMPADETIFVGNGDEDRLAAEQAGCQFILADEFFGRSTK